MTSSSKDTLFLCFTILSLPNEAPGSLLDFTRHLCLCVLRLPEPISISGTSWELFEPLAQGHRGEDSSTFIRVSFTWKIFLVNVKVSCMLAISLINMVSSRHLDIKEVIDTKLKLRSGSGGGWGATEEEGWGDTRLDKQGLVLHNPGGPNPFWSRTQTRVKVRWSSSSLIIWRNDINSWRWLSLQDRFRRYDQALFSQECLKEAKCLKKAAERTKPSLLVRYRSRLGWL